MKKFLNKIFILMFVLLLVPSFVLAEGEEDTEKEEVKAPVKVYEFYGDGCGFCASLNEWFDSIEEEYGDYFDLVKYEVWSSKENSELMDLVAKELSMTASSIPYVVIGNKTTEGFNEEIANEILANILEEYEKEEADRVDVVAKVIKETGWGQEKDTKVRDLIFGVIGVGIVVGLVFVIIQARKED